MKLLPMFTIKLNGINFVFFYGLVDCTLWIHEKLNSWMYICCLVVNDQYLHVFANQFSADTIWLTLSDILVELP